MLHFKKQQLKNVGNNKKNWFNSRIKKFGNHELWVEVGQEGRQLQWRKGFWNHRTRAEAAAGAIPGNRKRAVLSAS
jgi:hypothetical protein